jgi:hypothetical protein
VYLSFVQSARSVQSGECSSICPHISSAELHNGFWWNLVLGIHSNKTRLKNLILVHISLTNEEPGYLSCIAQGYGLDDRGFEARQGLGYFLFIAACRPTLGPTQPIQWVPEALSLWENWSQREADHSPPSCAGVKECVELYIHSSNTPSWRGEQLKSTGTNAPLFFLIFSHLILECGHETMRFT